MTKGGDESSILEQKKLVVLIVLIEIFCIIFHSIAGYYETTDLETGRYPLWQDINVMIFVGFGFLMTFLRTYQFSAVGYTFLIGAISFQYYPIWELIWQCAFDPDYKFTMHLSIDSLMLSSFCAGAVLITYGGIIGKVSGFQLILIQVIETIGYSLNERLQSVMGVADVGGSMVIHTFGAVFGIVVTKILTPRDAFGHKKAESNYYSDLTAFIGTIFLWMYWPSFNAGPAVLDSPSQTRAFVNTILSLSGSCMATFVISILTRDEGKRLNMIDIQNATLAGGVAMGTCASMNINPIWAILIGISTGIVSALGFSKLQPYLESKVGLHDTCGILNLHCMPGILGGIWGAVAAACAENRGDSLQSLLAVYPKADEDGWSAQFQSGHQIIFLAISIGISIGTALIAGFVVRLFGTTPASLYEDGESYHIPRIRFEDVDELIAKLPKLPQSQVVLVTDPLNTSHQMIEKNKANGKHANIELEQRPIKEDD